MRWTLALWFALCCGLVPPALAHERATARLDRPADGTVVTGDTVEVVVTATGTGTPAEFRLLLDGKPVDEAGTVGGSALFTTFRLAPGVSKRLLLPLAGPGPHTLRLEPTVHPDRPEPVIVRTFTSRAEPTPATPTATSARTMPSAAAPAAGEGVDRGTALVVMLGGALLAAGVAAVILARRRPRAG